MAVHQARREERIAQMDACLQAAGLNIEADAQGGYGPFASVEEGELFMRSFDGCLVALGLPEAGAEPSVNAYQLQLEFAFMLDLQDCLMAHGYPVSVSPSEDHWVEANLRFADGDFGANIWHPFEAALTDATVDIVELETVCPQPFVLSWDDE